MGKRGHKAVAQEHDQNRNDHEWPSKCWHWMTRSAPFFGWTRPLHISNTAFPNSYCFNPQNPAIFQGQIDGKPSNSGSSPHVHTMTELRIGLLCLLFLQVQASHCVHGPRAPGRDVGVTLTHGYNGCFCGCLRNPALLWMVQDGALPVISWLIIPLTTIN